jgi:hypothetical protein
VPVIQPVDHDQVKHTPNFRSGTPASSRRLPTEPSVRSIADDVSRGIVIARPDLPSPISGDGAAYSACLSPDDLRVVTADARTGIASHIVSTRLRSPVTDNLARRRRAAGHDIQILPVAIAGAVRKAACGNQVAGPVMCHIGQLIRPDQRRNANLGPDSIMCVQHVLGERWRAACDRREVRAASVPLRLCPGDAAEGGQNQQGEELVHNVDPDWCDGGILPPISPPCQPTHQMGYAGKTGRTKFSAARRVGKRPTSDFSDTDVTIHVFAPPGQWIR